MIVLSIAIVIEKTEGYYEDCFSVLRFSPFDTQEQSITFKIP